MDHGETAGADKDMDMRIEFQVSPEGMANIHNARNESTRFAVIQKGLFSALEKEIECRSTVGLDDFPQISWDSENNVLVRNIGKGSLKFINPVIRGHFSTGRTKSGFTGQIDFFEGVTKRTDVLDKTESGFTSKHFGHVYENSRPDSPEVKSDKANPI